MTHKDNLKLNIAMLPVDVQKRIYILTWRKFWREYIPLTAKVPSWYNHKVKTERIIYEARLKNIHFLHLPFNTLEENKQWIMGCQCDHCKTLPKKKYKRKLYHRQFLDDTYFLTTVPTSYTHYNEKYYIDDKIPEQLQYSYDPLFGSVYEDYDKYALRTNKIKLKFI